MAQAQNPLSPSMAAIIVHGRDDAMAAAVAATALGVPVVLATAPGGGGYAGAGWFTALMTAVRVAHPAVTLTGVLDCGDRPGAVLTALRAGVRDIRFSGEEAAAVKLQAIAAASGARLWPDLGAALDLRDLADPRDKAIACRTWLATAAGVRPPAA